MFSWYASVSFMFDSQESEKKSIAKIVIYFNLST